MSDDKYYHPRVIWLQPWCDECDRENGDGRMWCQDDAWGECDHCGKKAIRYVMSQKPVEEKSR